MIKLSERLTAIAGFVEKGETVADVGTDHGFLPLYLLEKGISTFVVMTDVSRGSLEKARQSCKDAFGDEFDARLGRDFDLRLGDGLVPLRPGEIYTVIMAGMGGLLMSEIMGFDPDKTCAFGKFVLQPRNNAGKLRKWLDISGYEISGETLVRERGRICEIISAVPADPEKAGNTELMAYDLDDDVTFEYPLRLVESPNPLTEEYLLQHLEKEKVIKSRIMKGKDRTKLAVTEERIGRLESLLEKL